MSGLFCEGSVESDSTTSLQVFEGKYYWTISDWRSQLNGSLNSEEATIYSEVFEIPIDGNKITCWQIKAFPKLNSQNGQHYLAFRLVSHNAEVPRGTFHFVTYTKNMIMGKQVNMR